MYNSSTIQGNGGNVVVLGCFHFFCAHTISNILLPYHFLLRSYHTSFSDFLFPHFLFIFLLSVGVPAAAARQDFRFHTTRALLFTRYFRDFVAVVVIVFFFST